MPAVRPAVAFAVLLLAPVLAGCLGGDPLDPQEDSKSDGPDVAPLPRQTAVVDNAQVDLAPWVVDLGDVRHEPRQHRLMPLAHDGDETGQFRLMTDGSTFVLIAEADEVGDQWLLAARVNDVNNNITVARGVVASDAGAPRQLPVALPLLGHESLRLNTRYALEVHWLAPDDPGDTLLSSNWIADNTTGSLRSDDPGAAPVLDAANLTHLRSWQTPLSFRPTWDLTFDGPATGVDRPDTFERSVFGGPETGTYTAKLTAERLWLAAIEVDLASSEIADTFPSVAHNGTTGFRIDVVGHRSLDAFLYLPRTRGVDQSFSLEIEVDYEMFDDLQTEEGQFFSFTSTMGYRIGGQTYVAAVDGRDIKVDLTQEPTPPL